MSSILTNKAAAKLKALRAYAEDQNAVANVATRRAGELRSAMAFVPPPPDGANRNADAMSVEAAERQAEVDRLQAHAGVQHAKANAAVQLVAQIDHFLTTPPPGVRLIDAKPIRVEHQNFQEAVRGIRAEIGDLDAEIKRVNRAGPTKSERLKLAEDWAYDLVGRAKPTVKVTHAKLDVSFGIDGALLSKTAVASALVAWAVGPEQLQKRIIEVLDAQPEPAITMSADAKTKRLAELRSELEHQQRLEEAVIEFAALNETIIPRRPAAWPLAVLGLEMVTAKKVAAA